MKFKENWPRDSEESFYGMDRRTDDGRMDDGRTTDGKWSRELNK